MRDRRRLLLPITPLLILAAGACSDATAPQEVGAVVVTPAAATVASRAPLPLSARVTTAGGRTISGHAVAWQSSDAAVAQVSHTGLVTAGVVTGGTPLPVTITATADGHAGQALLTVTPSPVGNVSLTPPAPTLDGGATQQLTATLSDALGVALSGRVVAWGSSDTGVATVDAAGLVAARPYGGAETRATTITATSEGRSGSAVVQVRPVAVATVAVAPESVAVEDTRQLQATLRGAGGLALTGRSITWTASDTTVATVTPTGLAVPRPYWTNERRATTLTATSEGVSGSTTLQVLPARVATVRLTPAGSTLDGGMTVAMQAVPVSLSGAPLDGRPVAWSSSNTAAATVDDSGHVQAALLTTTGAQAVTITATVEGRSASVQFTVLPSPVATVTVTPDSLAMPPASTAQLAVALANAAGDALGGRAIAWTSTDTAVATVSATGLVTARPYLGALARTARIVATSEGVADTARVDVPPAAVASVLMMPNIALLPPGAAQPLHATPRDAAGRRLDPRPVTWASSDAGIATVTDSGVATVIGGGTATITATIDSRIGTAMVGSIAEPLLAGSLTAGGYHQCGLTAGGDAYCWGYNGYGQLGNGSTADPGRPVKVLGGHAFTSISAGALHTCGLVADGTAYCWGWNSTGQLGDSTIDFRTVPTRVAGTQRFAQLAAAWNHSCAITAAGAAWCWGRNNIGQLGDGTTVDRSYPAPVLGGLVFTSIVGRYGHTCGLTAAGQPWCWGRNQWGAIGDGSTTFRTSPVPMQMPNGLAFVELVLGWDHSCGRTSAGAVHCVGRNQYGQLADGTENNHTAPTPIIGGISFRSLHSGFYHMCGIGVDGVAYCWGRNNAGQVGDDAFSDHYAPMAISAGRQFLNLGGSYSHTCGIIDTGAIHCWGVQTNGQLGDAAPPPDLPFAPQRLRAGRD